MAQPDITLQAAHFDNVQNSPIYRIVIHATAGGRGFPAESAAGTARQTAEYFQRESTGGSAHYIEDVSSEEHCVSDSVVAWHAPPNVHSIGIEICAEATYNRDQWLSPEVWPAVVNAANRCRELADRYEVPKVKLNSADLRAGRQGICGHFDVSQAWHQSSHWDPGPDFPWDRFLAEVNGGPAPAPALVPPRPAWTLPPGHYYGNVRGPAKSHGGYYKGERVMVKIIQQWLIYRGCVDGISPSEWATNPWADGEWETPTDAAMSKWHSLNYPQPFPKQCWSDDYYRLIG